jgi:lysozyme family protein
MNFDQAFDALLKHEGGYSDHAADPGGKTRYGITEAVAREVGYRGEMRELPLELAQRIYRERYWDAVKADQLPSTVRYLVFDAAVNSGVGQAARWLQRAVKVKDDGVIGPMTLMAANQSNPEALARRVLAQRLRFMSGLANWPAFSRGWARRIADLMEAA